MPIPRSSDPNDKLAPIGFSENGFVQPDGSFAYTIRFENQPEATGPAREIIVTDVLHNDLDLDTFELTEIAFADQTIAIPPGMSHYEAMVPMNANGTEIVVEVKVDLDRETRLLTFSLLAIDPSTGWQPEDPLIGILYPNDETHRGEGHISYVVKSKAGLPSGTVIENRARIFFDFNDPIDTPLVFNTIDAGTPTSSVQALPAAATDRKFEVHWSGEDEPGGSGIAGYDVYVSENGGEYTLWLSNVAYTSAEFIGEPGRTYSFYSIARDGVGHVEAASGGADAVTLVPTLPPELVAVGAGRGGGPAVRVFDSQTGDMIRFFFAYARSFRGGVTVATADVNDDGISDIITGPGEGGGPLVRVFDGATGEMINQFFAFGKALRSGIWVATGDVDGDGTPEVIVAPRAGGGPAARVFDALTGEQIGDNIWAFGKGFRGGVLVATGDLDGDGADEIIAAAGPGGGPAFRVFNGDTGEQMGETTFAYDRSFRGGLTVSTGDLDGDGDTEIIVGPGAGPGTGPLVRIFDGTTLSQVQEFFAFGQGFPGGVTVAASDVNGDWIDEVIVGVGSQGAPAVRAFEATTGTQVGETLFAFGRAFRGGITVHGRAIGLPVEGSLLRIEGREPVAAGSGTPLADAALAPIVSAARTRLANAGLPDELLAELRNVQFVIADLGGDLLGIARPGLIHLDDDAAGLGWFVDYSPMLDEEFFENEGELVAHRTLALSQIDLLSVVLHELGHAAGLDHDADLDSADWMASTLQPGRRKLPSFDDFDALFAADECLELSV